MVVLVITVLAFLVSLGFNLLQLRWRKEEREARAADKAEQKRKDDEKEAGQRRREQAAPQFGENLVRKPGDRRAVYLGNTIAVTVTFRLSPGFHPNQPLVRQAGFTATTADIRLIF
jgi:hypothetical protein